MCTCRIHFLMLSSRKQSPNNHKKKTGKKETWYHEKRVSRYLSRFRFEGCSQSASNRDHVTKHDREYLWRQGNDGKKHWRLVEIFGSLDLRKTKTHTHTDTHTHVHTHTCTHMYTHTVQTHLHTHVHQINTQDYKPQRTRIAVKMKKES